MSSFDDAGMYSKQLSVRLPVVVIVDLFHRPLHMSRDLSKQQTRFGVEEEGCQKSLAA
jgi:hypothetical protein